MASFRYLPCQGEKTKKNSNFASSPHSCMVSIPIRHISTYYIKYRAHWRKYAHRSLHIFISHSREVAADSCRHQTPAASTERKRTEKKPASIAEIRRQRSRNAKWNPLVRAATEKAKTRWWLASSVKHAHVFCKGCEWNPRCSWSPPSKGNHPSFLTSAESELFARLAIVMDKNRIPGKSLSGGHLGDSHHLEQRGSPGARYHRDRPR